MYEIAEKFLPDGVRHRPRSPQAASPLRHVRAGLPPFLILYAEKDFPGCGKVPSEVFAKALKDKEDSVETMEIKGSNHILIILSAGKSDDAVFKKILEFITAHVKK